MENNKRDRAALKSYFKTNAVPTEGNFIDLIDGTLNLREDGIAKPSGDPLAIEAAGAVGSQKNVLQLFESFADTDPAWVLGLRPINASSVQKQGLSISEKAGGVSRFFIDRASGNVGVGTIEPAARLHVAGDLRVDGALQVNSIATNAGLKIPAGQPVSGVQVIDFKPCVLTAAASKALYTGKTTVTFDQPVRNAFVVVQGMRLETSSGDLKALAEIRIETSAKVSTTNNKDVLVTVYGGMLAGSLANGTNYDSNIVKQFDLLVIAILENAV